MDSTSQTWDLAGRSVVVSHPTKVLWPEDYLTKEQMLRYYERVAPFLLMHMKDRPVTLRIFPDGILGASHYRRDAPQDAPQWLRTVDYQIETAERVIQLPLIDGVAGLLWLAEGGATEFHLWASRAPSLQQPDVAIFDLDPGDQASFALVLQVALRVRDSLQHLGISGYAKTSGGRGLHVYVPLAPGHTFEAVRAWVKALAEELSAARPEQIGVAHGATHRGPQVTVDHAQNSVGRNTASVYTLRAHSGAPVSTPLTWEEIEEGRVRPGDWTLRTVPDRLMKVGDLFAPVLQGGQSLPD
jgi:bifunctional non-homologous end joining protein LigD